MATAEFLTPQVSSNFYIFWMNFQNHEYKCLPWENKATEPQFLCV